MLEFEKYHGTGNDFVLIYIKDDKQHAYSALAVELCDRHFGVGADGLLILERSDQADFKMRIFNQDGSEAPMCGNGIRCVAKYVMDKGLIEGDTCVVETMYQKIQVSAVRVDGKTLYRINMGSPIYDTSKMPVLFDKSEFQNESIEVDGQVYTLSALNMGTIHAVTFVDEIDQIDIDLVGSTIEQYTYFPQGINVDFCKVIDPHTLKVTTWERGVGRTMSCGTGVSASVAQGIREGKLKSPVKVLVTGGELLIEKRASEYYMSGPAVHVFSGQY
ncbi:diaminopimelate epimerase [Fusibacter tunisiensis]|uniref:Diaminopimelate epimerase n=2 Tax=Fusibacter tunisiensis TaxID=1008308 RepID=A0ABS2MTQ9_9FIRM|nr:diaminopimelate epimerase [Fusibacter tunisiensis]